jgi:HAMP domain-containing protein
MEACSSVLSPDGKLIGTIGVVTDAAPYLRESQQTLTGVATAAIGVIVVGILITVLVSGLISRELRNLSHTAALISGGNLDVQARAGRIQEIGDLGNTFNTMSDVLKDVLSRTKRSLIEGEQFRTHAELAMSYAEMFRPPIAADFGEFRCATRSAGQDFGLFWTAFETPEGFCMALGHVKDDDDVSTAIAGSAAVRYLKHRLTKSEARQALTELSELFHPDFLECYCFGDASVDHWRIGAVGAPAPVGLPHPPSALAPVGLPHPPSALVVQSFPADSRRRWILHRFVPDAGRMVDEYLTAFGHHTPDDLAHDIIAALPPGSAGALIVAGKR